jgi:hypothetical protein
MLLFLVSATPARAETSDPPASPPHESDDVDDGEAAAAVGAGAGMDNVFSGFGLLNYWYAQSGLGVGVRYQKTLAAEGVLGLPGVRDDIGVEAGVDYAHYSFDYGFGSLSYNEIAVLVGGVWNFWFLQNRLALYPKIDMGYRFGSWSGTSLGGYGGIVLQGSAGIAYRLSRLTLRAEAGSGSLRLGAGLAF